MIDRSKVNTRKEMLVDAVRMLAMSPERQEQYISEHDCHIDELCLDFEGWYRAIADMTMHGELSEHDPALPVLDAINDIFEKKSGNSDPLFWTIPALWKDESWDRIRILARIALEHLGQAGTGSSKP